MSSGKFDEAASVWKQLMQVVPNDPEYLGQALLTGKRYTEAAAAFEAAIKLSPKSAALYTELGSAHLQAGDERNVLTALPTSSESRTGTKRNEVQWSFVPWRLGFARA